MHRNKRGCHADTQGDFDGVNLAAVRALATRTAELRDENAMLRNELAALRARMDALDGGRPGRN